LIHSEFGHAVLRSSVRRRIENILAAAIFFFLSSGSQFAHISWTIV
jgi:hypothetical protein